MDTYASKLELWGGLECTVNRVRDTWFDQCSNNGHYERQDDLDRFAALGIRRLRYPVLWERAQRGTEGAFDFSWVASRLERLQALGIDVIAGLVHHGSGPPHTSLVDPQFPEKLARYARAVATRFPHLGYYTPINEPLTTARFSGLYGVWYPHGKNNGTFLNALVNECRGTVLAMREIRAINPHARLVQTDDIGRAAGTGPCAAQVRFENERRWLGYDLLFGRVDSTHALWGWLLQNGITQEALEWFLENPCPPNVVGINHYPLSSRFLDHRLELYPQQFHCFREALPYADAGVPQAQEHLHPKDAPKIVPPDEVLREACARYNVPVAVTEVHVNGPREAQIQWLNDVWQAAQRVRAAGGDVCAVTVWSLLGSFDWNCLVSECRMYYEPGAFDIRGAEPRPTAIAAVAHSLATNGSCDHPLVRTTARPGSKRGTRARGRELLILGAGRLGKAFARIAYRRGLDYRLLGRTHVDIASQEQVRAALRARPYAVINAAGFSRVNAAEFRPDQAFRDNVQGSETLAAECRRLGIPLVAFSSHLVFDGEHAASDSTPYQEADPVRPLNVYGRTKAEMETRVMGVHPGALVVRAGSFLSPWDPNDFIARALKLLRTGTALEVAAEALFTPAYVPDLVDACIDLLIDGLAGVVHLSSEGPVTRADIVRTAAEFTSADMRLVRAQRSMGSVTCAQRPRFSALRSKRIGAVMPPVAEAIERHCRALRAEGIA